MRLRSLLLRLAWILPLVAVLAVLGAAVLRAGRSTSIAAALARGHRPPAPAFRLSTLEGRALDLVELRGRPVVLNFWASWCGPCREEAPLLERAWQTYRYRGLVVVGVNIQDLEADARRFIRENGITYPNVRDRDGRVNRAYGVTGVPETFFIDPVGRIVRKFPGAVVTWRPWEEAIEQLLGDAGAR
ncbi:MAG: TlpA disulfide reductase family protein [Armatimonadota bacterium]|nr:TlpA disulfide reductase family protein [Armatimonadota bacterium]MDR7427885.1 TlpA disulfide reductase family protein [Armatimonadota bacterium]MDR7463888.1 TlpA disulfide reductase family protein [Armatimonadota bacterium]MDR7470058.1 TlpA disulfide reductase family protein [Armatimonadota bacterium]MDR7474420.1 TlpA disulfide reductase family protein [Armatimonadota bacterium]